VKHGADGAARASPASLLQGRDRQAEFELQDVFGMEVASAIASHDLQLAVDGFDDIGGGERERRMEFRVAEEGQVVTTFLAQFGDEGGVGFGEAIAEFFKLLMGNFQIPGRLEGPPALLKLDRIGFAEMGFGIALHVHGAELSLGIGKQPLSTGQKPGKIIVHENEHPAETAFQETA